MDSVNYSENLKPSKNTCTCVCLDLLDQLPKIPHPNNLYLLLIGRDIVKQNTCITQYLYV